MKCKGGFSVPLSGRPAGMIVTPPVAEVLRIPLSSRRFRFNDVRVTDGRSVAAGDVLATDEANHSVPLLAPAAGVVRRTSDEYITLEDIDATGAAAASPAGTPFDELLALGAWQFLSDAHTDRLPDPAVAPAAVIVSTVRHEPFVARGDVQLHDHLDAFVRGMTHLQSMLEYQPIHLILPDVHSPFARRVADQLRGHAWIQVERTPPRYGCELFPVVARRLGHRPSAGDAIWCLHTEGVLAIDRALTAGRPTLTRIIAIGGPCIDGATHVEAPVGYPIERLLDGRVSRSASEYRVLNGGALTGLPVDPAGGIDAECIGITVLADPTGEETLGWLRPGFDRRSYSGCFASRLRAAAGEALTTAVRGERRPCISCTFCEEACPAGVMPHLIHKLLYQDLLDEAEDAGVQLCVECGLCSYVCPSKIELRRQFADCKQRLLQEARDEESHE